MRKLVLALGLLLSTTSYAGINQTCSQFTAAGAPQYKAKAGDQELCHKNYAVIHRCEVKAPVAVFEHLTVAAMTGPSKRKNDFRPDPLVTPAC